MREGKEESSSQRKPALQRGRAWLIGRRKEGLYSWSRGSKGKGDVGRGRGRRWRPDRRPRRSVLFREEEWMRSY